MPDSLAKVQSGEKLRIPAAAYNAFIDTAIDLRQRQQSKEQAATPSARQTDVILLRNDSGQDRGRFDVLGITNTVITPAANPDAFKSKIALAGVKPLVAQHVGRLAILLEPVATGKLGQAIASGVTPVRVNITDEGHPFADIGDNDATQLVSAGSGAAAILWKESGTGTKWAVVRIGAGGGSMSEGQYQFMVYQMVAQNQAGWDFVRAHPLLDDEEE